MADRREKSADEYLVLESRSGDSQAFEHLVQRYQKPLWRFAYRLTGSEDGAWDVLQETWMGITHGLKDLKDPARFRSWAFGIVRRRASDFHRKRQERSEDSSMIDQVDLAGVEKTTDQRQRVNTAILRLPVQQRAVLILHYLDGFDVWEIAEILEVPQGTVKSRLFHARAALKDILERSEP